LTEKSMVECDKIYEHEHFLFYFNQQAYNPQFILTWEKSGEEFLNMDRMILI